MVSGGPCLHLACGVITLFVYVASCMHGQFDPVLLGISSGCFGVVVSLSVTRKHRAILSEVRIKVHIPKFGVSKFIYCPSLLAQATYAAAI